ncbi:MAG: DUF4870 domain-containing protein [Patescibacteria group bacterium]
MSDTKKSQAQTVFTQEDIEKNKGMAIIAYIIFFVPLLTDSKDSPYVKFHVKQAIMLVLASVVVSIAGTIIPFIGWFLIAPFGTLALLVLWVIGILNAVNGEAKELPVLGKYAEQYLKF